ncbi:Speckle targeted PIP5K1A-regulated poly(A) polymerase [Orchesella cincta]|uniref:Speckle targeted PIP5K1A-regulated poly(A) polymerase n=1 Tax=Orchesella cincta TaxID=48709 RepID=A0A1D2MM25_ORCCI|nr:Speckle targeted PIP5K1A-regulated poly(A) polymerase [Orchesella cincta]
MGSNGTVAPGSLEEQLTSIIQNIAKVPGIALSTPQKRSQVVQIVESDLRNSFLKCTVLPYGLDEVGIGEDKTDLYLSVDTYGKVDTKNKTLEGSVNINSSTYVQIAQQIFKILTSNPSSYQYVSLKPLTVYANTAFGNLMPTPLPEISFTHVGTNSSCKIRLENYFSVQSTRLLSFYSRTDIRFWSLLTLVRHWGTKFNALRSADSLYFQNYALSLLLLHFLISKKILPSVKNLQFVKDSGVDKPFIVNNFDASFCSNLSVVKPSGSANPALQDKELRTLSIVSILKNFFAFCSTFDFKEHVICPFIGQAIKRELFYPKSDWKSLPESISTSYLNGSDGKTRPEKLYLVGPICVQDVFELTTNVTRTVTEDEASKFTKNCASAAKILEDVLIQSDNVVLSDVFSNCNY